MEKKSETKIKKITHSAAGFLCQQSTKEIVCDDYEEEWKKSYEKTIEVTSEAEIFVQRSPIMMRRPRLATHKIRCSFLLWSNID